MVEAISSGKYPFVMCNFAPPDMVGHTGVYEAAVIACAATGEFKIFHMSSFLDHVIFHVSSLVILCSSPDPRLAHVIFASDPVLVHLIIFLKSCDLFLSSPNHLFKVM